MTRPNEEELRNAADQDDRAAHGGKPVDSSPVIVGQSELASRIQMYREKFNATQNRIADFILKDEKAVLQMSIYEMAEKIGTSVATVTRFSQLIGYEGLADMKFHMQQQAVVLSQDIGIARDDSINVIKQKVLQFSENALHSCFLSLDNDALEQAVDAVDRAGSILLCAAGSASGIVQTATGLFLSMGFRAFGTHDVLIMMRQAVMLREGDVLIAISYDGQAKNTGDVMMLAKKSGAKVILITAVRESLLSRYADCILLTPPRTGGNAMNITATTLCQLSIIQLLMLGAMTRDGKGRHERSRVQLQLSDLNRYDIKQKEITLSRVRNVEEN